MYCIHFKIKAHLENIYFALCIGTDKRFYYKILLLLLCSFIVILSLLLHFPRTSDFPRRAAMVTSVVPSGRHVEDSGLLFLEAALSIVLTVLGERFHWDPQQTFALCF